MNLRQLILKTPYLDLDDAFYDRCDPVPLESPYLISFNPNGAQLIDLDVQCGDDPLFVSLLNGTFTPKGGRHFSMSYGGHQFGHYNPWLGDGRVAHLGAINGWNVQLKGSGPTRYARLADGRATLASSIREYLMGEAMHYLGIASTRSLGIIGSITPVMRARVSQAAVVLRMSKSWVRFGTFEYFYYQKAYDKLKMLADYVIAESFSDLQNDEARYIKMFSRIVDKTATLVASWQAVGFCHGVMNTDNMSIDGITIDYGPFAMMDDFKYGYVCNHTDRLGRYSYADQPNIAYWNLEKLAHALTPLIPKDVMQQKLDDFGAVIYPQSYIARMREKLGLLIPLEGDLDLIEDLLVALEQAGSDYTLFFRTLSRYDGHRMAIYDIVADPVAIDAWLAQYDARLMQEIRPQEARHEAMLSINPKYVLKNHMLHEAIAKAQSGDFSMVETLLYIAAHPYEELEGHEHFATVAPFEFNNSGLSCAS